jgi:hypothetical protein
MPSFECNKCVSPITVPDNWTNEKKTEVAALIREKDSLTVIQYFRPIGMDISEAKGIFLHVTREKDHCHHCKTNLVEYEGNCPKCKRLNLDW